MIFICISNSYQFRPFFLEEVKQAIWDCDSFKSPGQDDINFGFIKQFWLELKDDFMRFVVEFHRNGKLTKGVNATFITLIPKIDSPQRLNDLCPISMVGCMYKVLLSFWKIDSVLLLVMWCQILSRLLFAENKFWMAFWW